jgi:hypothetical protein
MRKLTFRTNLSWTAASPRPATTSAGACRATSCSNGGPLVETRTIPNGVVLTTYETKR